MQILDAVSDRYQNFVLTGEVTDVDNGRIGYRVMLGGGDEEVAAGHDEIVQAVLDLAVYGTQQ